MGGAGAGADYVEEDLFEGETGCLPGRGARIGFEAGGEAGLDAGSEFIE